MIEINLNFDPGPRAGCKTEAPPATHIYQFPIDDYVYIMPAPDRSHRRARVRTPELLLPEPDGALVRLLGWIGSLMDGRRG